MGIFVRILPPFIIGSMAFYGLPNSISLVMITWTAIGCTILLIYLMVVNLFYKKLRMYRHKTSNGLVWSLFLVLFGGFWSLQYNEPLTDDFFALSAHKLLKVTVNEEPRLKNGVLRFKATVDMAFDQPDSGVTVGGSLMIAILTDSLCKLSLEYGDQLLIPANFSPVKVSKPGSGFDYKAWLATQNIYHQAFLRQQQVSILKENNGNPVILFALKLRKRQVAFYRKIIKTDEAFAVAATLILGYRSDLDKNTLDIYSKTGTIHALSVSGMHVGLVYLVLNWLLQFMNSRRWLSLVKLVFIMISVWFYALLTGFSPSVLRSVIMLSVFIISKSISKKTDNFNIMAFAAFSLLLYNPFLLWDVGFQLSFAAVAGLIWIQPMIQNWWNIERKWIYRTWGTIAMSLSAQYTTLPLSLFYFHQFPVYFLASNLFILLPIALLMYLGIFILLFKAAILGPAFEWLICFTNDGLGWIASLPYASIGGIYLSKTELVLLSVSLSLFILACATYQKRLLFAALIAFLAFESLQLYNQVGPDSERNIISLAEKR